MRMPTALAVPVALLPVAICLLLLWVVSSLYGQQEDGGQPIAYNHKVHLTTAGMNCNDCHVYVEKGASASIPNVDVCQVCHTDQPLTASPEEAKLLTYVKEKRVIPWRRVYTVPDHVYFSHARHVTDGGIDCATCHGKMTEQTAPVTSQALAVTMKRCLGCHKEQKASTDCLSCHM